MAKVEYPITIDLDRIWYIDRVESYWYRPARNQVTYVEITFWFDPYTKEREETVRKQTAHHQSIDEMPPWCWPIDKHKINLDYD